MTVTILLNFGSQHTIHHFLYLLVIKLSSSKVRYLTKYDVDSGKQFQVSHAVIFPFLQTTRLCHTRLEDAKREVIHIVLHQVHYHRHVLVCNVGACWCNGKLRPFRFKAPLVLIHWWIKTPPVLILWWNKTPSVI